MILGLLRGYEVRKIQGRKCNWKEWIGNPLHTAWYHIPEKSDLHIHHYVHLRSHR
jgi:hypothetical protein